MLDPQSAQQFLGYARSVYFTGPFLRTDIFLLGYLDERIA